jgi:hypothetical protein
MEGKGKGNYEYERSRRPLGVGLPTFQHNGASFKFNLLIVNVYFNLF